MVVLVILFFLFCLMRFAFSVTSFLVIGRNSLGAVWRKVMIAPPSKQDLINVVLQWYPELEYLALKLIGLLNFSCSVNNLCSLSQ